MGSRREHRGKGEAYRSRQWLLPMPIECVRSASLTAHLAFEACRRPGGNKALFHELTRVIYLSWFVREAGVGDAPFDDYCLAEGSMNRLAEVAEGTGIWSLDEDAGPAVLKILIAYDAQLATVSSRTFVQAISQLNHLLSRNGSVSPLDRTREAGDTRHCAASTVRVSPDVVCQN